MRTTMKDSVGLGGPATSESTVYMTTGATSSAGATLRFNHSFGFDNALWAAFGRFCCS